MKRVLRILLLAGLLLALPATALAAPESQEGGEGKVVMGGVYTLGPGQSLNEDLVILGGVATLADGSTVNGDVAVIGGALTANGTINGDVAAVGAAVTFGTQSVVTGDVQSFAAAVTRAEGAQVYGEEITGQIREPDFPLAPIPPSIPSVPFVQSFTLPPQVQAFSSNPLWAMGASGAMQGVSYIVQALLMAGLAILVVIFWPKPTLRTSQAIAEAPWSAAGLGVLTGIVAPVLLLILTVTICLIPLAIIGLLLFIAAIVFGWIAVGYEIGLRLARAFKWSLEPAPAAGLGTLLVWAVANGIAFIPCVGWLAPLVVGAIGLGGVLLTRFGTRDYSSTAASAELALPPA
jgi:hypothetical protein